MKPKRQACDSSHWILLTTW